MCLSCLSKILQVAPMYSWAYKGTSIFSLINIVLVTISTCFIVGFLSSFALLFDPPAETLYLCTCACVVICLTLIFSMLLYYGMQQKKPVFVLAYIIFGSVVELSVVALLTVFKNYNLTWRTVRVFLYIDRFFDSGYYYIAGVCVVYAFILCMVYHTYNVMVANASYHQALENECGDGKPSTPYYLTKQSTPYYLTVPTLLPEKNII